jgi:hypothetical protein
MLDKNKVGSGKNKFEMIWCEWVGSSVEIIIG